MWKKLLLLTVLGLMTAALPFRPAAAQATRTWVSGVGDDVNPCSRTAPCKTWAGAIPKTAARGEIDALDAGGFGAVTITKAITLDGGGGQVASVLASSGNGITVSAGASDIVIIRNMSINGSGGGINGIAFNSGAQLNVKNCDIFGFSQTGISANTSNAATSELYVNNSRFTNLGTGISLATSGTLFLGHIVNTTLFNTGSNGISSSGNGNINFTITNSVIVNTGTAITAGSAKTQFNVDTSSIEFGNTAFNASVSGATIRLSNNNIYNNGTNFTIVSGATIATTGNNRVTSAGGQAPNSTITQQ